MIFGGMVKFCYYCFSELYYFDFRFKMVKVFIVFLSFINGGMYYLFCFEFI